MTAWAFNRKALEYAKARGMVEYGDKIIIALSGGADSVALLFFLYGLSREYCLKLLAVHINHGLRGTEAERDEIFCRELCKRLGIPYESCGADVKKTASASGITLEEAGRLLRYEILSRTAEKLGGAKIAVAHNKNDNAETVLQRLIRGTGSKGLCGIPPVRGNIIRPLLGCHRKEIEEYLSELGQDYCVDSTNLVSDYTRNKLRNVVIPYLEKEINPLTIDAAARLAEQMEEQESFLTAIVRDEFENVASISGSEVFLDIKKLAEKPAFLQKRIIRTAVSVVADKLKDISQAHVDAAIRLMCGPGGKYIELPLGIIISKNGGRLIFTTKNL